MRSRQTSIASTSREAGSSASETTDSGALTITSCAPLAAVA